MEQKEVLFSNLPKMAHLLISLVVLEQYNMSRKVSRCYSGGKKQE